MANSLSDSFPEYWSRRMQRKHNKEDVYRGFANFEEKKTLTKGDTVHRPYRSTLTVNTLGSEGSYTRQDITDTDESLSIDTEMEVSFYVRKIDEIQSNYKTANHYADDSAVKLGNWIDGDALGEYDQATSSVDDGDLGETSGNGITATVSNIYKIFAKSAEKLDKENISLNDRWAVLSPQFKNTLWEYLQGKDTPMGDEVGKNGRIGDTSFCGFRLHLSNSIGWSSRLEFGTNPSDGDTITITPQGYSSGVTFTFKATLGSTAGNVHICSTAAKTLDELVEFINAPGTSVSSNTDAGIVALSSADQKKMKGITATDGTTYMTLKGEGVGYATVSETLTASADVWTSEKQIQHLLFGQGKPVDVVIQKYPNLEIKDRTGYLGKDLVTWTVYGIKTFSEGADQLVDVKIRSDAY